MLFHHAAEIVALFKRGSPNRPDGSDRLRSSQFENNCAKTLGLALNPFDNRLHQPLPEITEPEQLYQPRLLAEAEERALRLVSDADDSESEFLFVQPQTESPASESVDVPPAAPGVTAPEQPRSESSRFADLFTRLRQMQKGA